MSYGGLVLVLLLCISFRNILANEARDCSEDDMQYVYTECGGRVDNKRWRVSVPKPGVECAIVHPKPPASGPECDSSCKVGEYMDVAGDQRCKSCPAGNYSVGNGVRYDQWDKLPEGFSVSAGNTISLLQNSADGCKNTSGEQTWVPRGQYIEGVPSACRQALVLTVELVKDGELTVSYMNTYSGVVAMVLIESLCQSTAVGDASGFDNFKGLKSSKTNEYKTTTFKVLRGKNRIAISLMGWSGRVPSAQFAIQSMEITGMPFATECTPCKPGYYSSAGSGFCTHCPENTHASNPGSSVCIPCEETDYAPPGSVECKARPPCTAGDYFKSISSCKNGTTQVTYEWLTPHYCNVNDPISVTLPPPGVVEDCPPCNPGQALSETTGECGYCPSGKYSDGSHECQLCPLHTEARHSLVFSRFQMMPKRMYTSCLKLAGGGSFCDMQSTWVPSGNCMQVSDAVDDEEFSVLNVNVSEFASTSIDSRVYGTLSLTFDMRCEPSDYCLMYLMQVGKQVSSLATWNQTTPRTVFRYNFTDPNIDLLNLAFRKTLHRGAEPSKNIARVYDIRLTNTKEGGAFECTECALGGSKHGCRSCASGEIIVTSNVTQAKSCKKCPDNHIKVDSFTCLACGPGLVSNSDYTECVSNCRFTSNDGLKFNFGSIAGLQAFSGANMFTADGTAYHQAFNTVLCTMGSRANPALATCVNNATDSFYWEDEQSVTSLVCRETILPTDTLISLQPTDLGDTLTAITTNHQETRDRLTNVGGVRIDKNELSIHYKYFTSQSTDSCVHGLSTTLTLICDSRESASGTKMLPPRCVSGTCDGCVYDLVWRTIAACPICTESDYEKILGECIQGTQTVHYLPQKYCPMTDEIRNKKSTQPCTILTLEIKIAIGVAAAVAILLLLCAICCWKRSRKLEYKYMSLVDGAQGNTGELPAAQTCAWSDEEEEETDRVAFKTKGDQLFGKLGNKTGKSDGFEKMKLVGSSLPEI